MSNYSNLDLDLIKKQISELAYIDEAKQEIINEIVPFNPLIIRKNINETSEVLKLLNNGFILNFDGIINISDLLTKADKGIMLEAIELRNILVFHNNCERIKKVFRDIDKNLSIYDYLDSITINNSIFEEVFKAIDNNGDIKDDASDVLKSINNQIKRVEQDLYNRAHVFINKNGSSLQENNIFIRNDRITFLVKNTDKNKFHGYNYGSSASGLAAYVEPEAFINLNNQKVQLLQDRQDEINRILMKLTYLISTISNEYRYNFESIKKLCVIFAKAEYGFKNSGVLAQINDNNSFEFYDLAHPLIDSKIVVSNTYRLYQPYQGIVISGSNTGGKTVSLKAIGLSIVMSYLGMPIIASSANIPLYKNVYIDIDDNQSIQDSLSTFSAHLTNINNILNEADTNCLILIDELISGTDPKQAQAISLAIMDKIKEIGSSFIITTHIDEIKNYAYDDPKIMLSAVGFDMDTLLPTYHYLENTVGSSNAIEIASRYIDDQNIINNAKNYLSQYKTKQDYLLDELANEISQYQKKNDSLIIKENELNTLKDEYDAKLSAFESEKNNIKQKYIDDLNEYINDIKLKAQEKLDSIKEKDNNIIKQFNELLPDEIIEEDEIIEFNVGDNVRIKDNEQIGAISAINGDMASITIRGLTVKTKLNDLTLMPKTSVKAKQYQSTKRYSRVPMELNVVGQRVEDALINVDIYLDKALAANMSSVKIVHGIGTGALKNAIRDKLKRSKFVKEYHDGDYYDGGSGVTIINFK